MPHPTKRLFTLLLPALALTLLHLAVGCTSVEQTDAPPPPVLNVYTSSSYSDGGVYDMFTEATGIEVRLIKGDNDALIAQIVEAGENSPADLFLAVDAGRLQAGTEAGIFQPVTSDVLEERIPAELRHRDGHWVGLSKRLRILYVSKDAPEDFATTYADLTNPRVKGELFIRTSGNVYNRSLVAWMIAKEGPEAAEAWVNGLVDNLAREPEGGDTDQIRAVARGEGKVAVSNLHYFPYMLDDFKPGDAELATKVRLVVPDQNGAGAMMNITGAGVCKHAPNRDNAIRFLEFMTTVEAQEAWVSETFEYPVVDDAKPVAVVRGFGEFKAAPINIAELGDHHRQAVEIMERAGWK